MAKNSLTALAETMKSRSALGRVLADEGAGAGAACSGTLVPVQSDGSVSVHDLGALQVRFREGHAVHTQDGISSPRFSTQLELLLYQSQRTSTQITLPIKLVLTSQQAQIQKNTSPCENIRVRMPGLHLSRGVQC